MRVVDAHAHITRLIPLGNVIRHMDSAGVHRAVVMAREADESRILTMARRYRGRVIPFIGGRLFQASLMSGAVRFLRRGIRHYRGFDKAWWRTHEESVFRDMERALSSGAFRGIGEIRLKHRGFGSGVPEMKCDYDFEADSPVILRLLETAGRWRVPVTIHLEVDVDRANRLDVFSRALKRCPRTKVIWAHGGPCDAPVMKRMLDRHPNLHAEIQPLVRNTYAHRVPYLKTFPSLLNGQGRLLAPWQRLFERHADRFLVGSDCRTAPEYRHLVTRMEDMRLILSQLPKRCAERIAFQNTEALFGR